MGRTNIVLDDELLAETMRITGKRTKKAAVEEAMRRTIRNQMLKEAVESLRGVGWEVNLVAMRQVRFFHEDGTPYDDNE